MYRVNKNLVRFFILLFQNYIIPQRNELRNSGIRHFKALILVFSLQLKVGTLGVGVGLKMALEPSIPFPNELWFRLAPRQFHLTPELSETGALALAGLPLNMRPCPIFQWCKVQGWYRPFHGCTERDILHLKELNHGAPANHLVQSPTVCHHGPQHPGTSREWLCPSGPQCSPPKLACSPLDTTLDEGPSSGCNDAKKY